MESVFQFVREVIGAQAILAALFVGTAIYAWYQHQRIKLLKAERQSLERRKTTLFEEIRQTHHTRSAVPRLGGPRILVADDDESIVQLIAYMLEQKLSGARVETARDGAATMEHIKRAKPELLILDLMMPGVSGLEVLKRLEVQKSNVPIVVISGFIGSKQGVAEEAGVDPTGFEFLPKPFTSDELVRLVSKLLAEKDKKR